MLSGWSSCEIVGFRPAFDATRIIFYGNLAGPPRAPPAVLKPDSDIEIVPEQARWLKVLWNQVPPTTLKKGREYAEGRRVSDLTADGNAIRARVLGGSGEQYSVE